MIRENWNSNWRFMKKSPSMTDCVIPVEPDVPVQLPHDAMIHEKRMPETLNGSQTGFYPGGSYMYAKKFYAPKDWIGKNVLIEFEGIYSQSMIYLNGNFITSQLYGYSNFYVQLDSFLEYEKENEILVLADNTVEQNSRWYTGSGIYRNVTLWIGNAVHIPINGVRITTITADEQLSEIDLSVSVKNIDIKNKKLLINTHIYDGEQLQAKECTHITLFMNSEEKVFQKIYVKNAQLWDCDSPHLYKCCISVEYDGCILDTEELLFGIRKLELDPHRGLRINGKSTKLRGTCIHHDNGLIGAASFEAAEHRKCHLLKAAGFNSIRSAHQPVSKAMLNACDKYGILVMDELTDVWTKHKNPNDYAPHFMQNLDIEIKRMVEKDYNHPSVIIYSAGNEIPEFGSACGAHINRHISNYIHELDSSRYTTTGINGLMALGQGLRSIAQDLLGEKEVNEEGASYINKIASMKVGKEADFIACHPKMTQALEEVCEAQDIIGLNYLTGRHTLEKDLHPNKTVIGTETFPADIVHLWDIVQNNSNVLGDYTWTGYDYLGEAGCGIFYYDGNKNFNGVYPDRLAYIGDINLIGYRRPISYLREIVYGLRKDPYIAVERIDKYGKPHSKTAWMLKDNISSWTWPGYEGSPANIDVYSSSDEVELFLNDVSLGKKPAGKSHSFTASFAFSYTPGTLLAISYQHGIETGRYQLQTAMESVSLYLDCDKSELQANGEDLAFITVKLKDRNGTENLSVPKNVHVSVEGAGTLLAFGNADPQSVENYDSDTWDTYDGQAMAVILSGHTPGLIKVHFSTSDGDSCEITIPVR